MSASQSIPSRLARPLGVCVHIYIYIYKLINLFIVVLGIHCSKGFSVVAVCRLLVVVASVVAEHGL